MTEASAADYRWLVGPEAEPWLALAGKAAGALHARTAALRRSLSPQPTHLVLEQVELRRRGAARFSLAPRLFFTPLGLEQATDELVARYKAGRFPSGPLIDLCCGIGGDLMALAQRGPVVGVDRSAAASLLAEANARVAVAAAAEKVPPRGVADGRELSVETWTRDVRDCIGALGEFAAWHIDPDRRPQGRRTSQLAFHEPGPELLYELLAASPSGAVKLAPACEVPDELAAQAELEWIGRRRECSGLVAWTGALAERPGLRRATLLAADGTAARSVIGTGVEGVPRAERIGRYLFEPDSAVLAARLQGVLAAEHGLAAIAPGIAYLTADAVADDPALAAFEVDAVMPFQPRRVKRWLRERQIGRLEIKKRGVPQKPEELRKTLEVPGDNSATLLLARVGGGVTAILGRRIPGAWRGDCSV